MPFLCSGNAWQGGNRMSNKMEEQKKKSWETMLTGLFCEANGRKWAVVGQGEMAPERRSVEAIGPGAAEVDQPPKCEGPVSFWRGPTPCH